MATAYVTFAAVGVRGNNMPVEVLTGPIASETVTTSGTSAQTSGTASGKQVAQIFCASALYALAGSSPTAAPATSIYVPASTLVYLGVADGDKVALIDV